MKKKILLLCKANVIRSKMGEVILAKILDDQGLDGSLDIESRGIVGVDSYMPREAQAALARAGYATVDEKRTRARQVQRTDWLDANLALTMSPELRTEMLRWYKNQPSLQAMLEPKLKVLPEYNITGNRDIIEIFDPNTRLVNPNDSVERNIPFGKKLCGDILSLFPGNFGNSVVYLGSLGHYVPSSASHKFRAPIGALYDQTLKELEVTLSCAVDRMILEGIID